MTMPSFTHLSSSESNTGPELTERDIRFIQAINAVPQELISDTINGHIDKVAARLTHRLAVDAWDGAMTYEQLIRGAKVMADLLWQKGIRRGDTAFISMPKSVHVPVSILAVLQVGAAFVFFEPDLPMKRLELMQAVADCKYAVVAQRHVGLACRLLGTDNVVAVCEDDVYRALDGRPDSPKEDEMLDKEQSPEDTAFLVFTSGSTGTPKAVEIQHHAWCSTYGGGYQATFGITDQTRVLQLSSYNFVLSCLEILATLMVGGVVCIPSASEQKDDLREAIHRLQPDWASMTPSLARIYSPKDFSSIRTLVLVGELIPNSIIETWKSSPGLTLLNGYGQSEACSMNSTAILLDEKSVGRNIGKSSWMRYWVVDPSNHDRLLPVGAVGELLVEGYAIAKGYRNNEQNTKASFVANPSWAATFRAGTDGRRFYKTGDLVQYQDSGDLWLFGRKDAQTKIRGQRMEPAEVEHHIMKCFHDEVQQVGVGKLNTQSDSGAEYLVAYLVLTADTSDKLADEDALSLLVTNMLQRIVVELSAVLPDWMVPTAIVLLKTLPKTVTGKLDRRLLQDQLPYYSTIPDSRQNTAKRVNYLTGTGHAMPKSAAEAQLSKIWATVLNVDPLDIHPDTQWIDLGGDSLSAMALVHEARSANFNLSFADIYTGSSLTRLASISRDRPAEGLAIRQNEVQVFAGEQLILTDFQAHCIQTTYRPTQSLVYYYDVQFRGNFDSGRLERALIEVINKTDSLRLRFDSVDLTQTVSDLDENEVAAMVSGADVPEQEEADALIAQPVLARIRSRNTQGLTLFLRLHHPVFDGTSLALLLEDIASSHVGNGTKPSPIRPQYLPYLKGRLLRQLPEDFLYWKGLLTGSSPTLLRVTKNDLFNSQGLTDTELSGVMYLGSGVPSSGATMSTILKAAWAILLSYMAGTNDVVFEYLVNGRDEKMPESQHIIGCCVNQTVARIQIEDEMPASQLLNLVGQQVLQSMPYAHLGSATIARECTDWGFDEGKEGKTCHYSSWLLHQNIPTVKHLGVGPAGYMDVPEPKFGGQIVSDFAVITFPYDTSAVKILILAHGDLYTEAEIRAVFTAFKFCIRTLVEGRCVVRSVKQRLREIDDLPVPRESPN